MLNEATEKLEANNNTTFLCPTYIDAEGHTEPRVRVTVSYEQGVRLRLGGTDDSPDVLIERRRNGWLVAITADGHIGDTAGLVYILDDGQSFVVPDGLPSRQIRWSEDVPKEIDKP